MIGHFDTWRRTGDNIWWNKSKMNLSVVRSKYVMEDRILCFRPLEILWKGFFSQGVAQQISHISAPLLRGTLSKERMKNRKQLSTDYQSNEGPLISLAKERGIEPQACPISAIRGNKFSLAKERVIEPQAHPMPSPRGKKITLPEQSSRIQSAPLTPLPYQNKIDGGNKTATKMSRKAKPLPL